MVILQDISFDIFLIKLIETLQSAFINFFLNF